MVNKRRLELGEDGKYSYIFIPPAERVYEDPCVECCNPHPTVDLENPFKWRCPRCIIAYNNGKIGEQLDDANIIKRYRSFDFQSYDVDEDNPNQRRAYGTFLSYTEDFDPEIQRNLIVIGGVGTGKTHLSVSVLIKLIREKRIQCHYEDMVHLVRKIKSTFNHKSPRTEDEVVQAAFQAPLLVLDELGHSDESDWQHTFLCGLIDHRYKLDKSTIVIANKDIEGMQESLGERAYSRLIQSGKVVEMAWGNYRERGRY